jgi:hypothetical protein
MKTGRTLEGKTMPRNKPIMLCEVEREAVGENEDEYREAMSRVSRAIPILAQVSERLAKRDAIVARLPDWSQFQEPKLFFCDSFSGSVLEWLNFDIKAKGYDRTYHTPSEA